MARLLGERYSASALKDRVGRGVLEYLELAEDLPGELRPIVTQIRRNRLTANLEHRGLERVTRTIEHASRNIAFSVIIAAMCVGSSILVLAARQEGMGAFTGMGIAGFAASSILTILMVASNSRRRGG